MKRGFELLKTRSLDDVIDVSSLEKEYSIELPYLYKLFLQTFKIEEKLIYTDRVYSRHFDDFFECSYFRTELDHDNIMFTGFLPIEQSFHIRETMYDKDDEIITKGYLPIGHSALNATLHLGTNGDEKDMLILESDKSQRFTNLQVNIFEFVRSIVLVEVDRDFMVDGILHSQLYKNWGEDFWRVKE
jgi:hypothetical protein